MGGQWFQKLVGFTAATFSSLMDSMRSANAAITFSTGVMFAIFFTIAIWQFWMKWPECEGRSIGWRMVSMFQLFKRQLIVYTLALAAPLLVSAFGGVARGNVHRAFALVNAMDGVAAQADSGMNALIQGFPAIENSAAAAMGITTSDFNKDTRTLAIHDLRMSPEARASRKLLQEINIKMEKDVSRLGNPNPNSPAGKQKAAFERQIALNKDLIQTGDNALKNISPAEIERDRAYKKAIYDQATESDLMLGVKAVGVGVSGTAGIIAGGKLGGAKGAAAGGVIGAGGAMAALGGYNTIKEYVDNEIFVPVVAAIFFAIAAVGVLLYGFAAAKQTIAIASYILSIWVMVTVGIAIAMPVSGLFMLCFLSDRTWHYGQNFISFWMSMVFGTLALATLATLLASAIPVATNKFVAAALQGIVALSGANSFTSLIQGTGYVLAGFFVASTALNVLTEMIRSGLKVGTGMWSGTFHG